MKLSQYKRNIVEHAAVAAVYDAQLKNLHEQILAIVSKLAAKSYKKATDIPQGWENYIGTFSQIRLWRRHAADVIGVASESFCRPMSGDSEYRVKEEEFPEPQLIRQLDAVYQARSLFSTEIRAILESVKTDSSLLEVAPELAKFLPELAADDGALVAVETIEHVRSLIQGASA